MIFFYAPKACSFASHLALEHVGAKYEAHRLDFSKNQQREDEYLNMNPKGRVPALLTDQGLITENIAILAFIAQSYPEAKLAPIDDPFQFARVQAFNSYLSSTVHVAHAHNYRGYRWVNADDTHSIEAMQAKVPSTMTECFQIIEDTMIEGPWVMGANYTICDMYLFTICQWLEGDGVDINLFPKVANHFQLMNEDSVVQRVKAKENLGSE
jgi:glutathione S-transferase